MKLSNKVKPAPSQQISLSHKIRLYPTENQVIQLNKAVGVSRFTYNWALEHYDQLRAEGIKNPKIEDIQVGFNSIKEEQFPWMYDSPKDVNQRPFTNLKRALANFFAKRTKYPTYKKRGENDSFYISNDHFRLTNTSINFSRKIGNIQLAEPLRFTGKIMSATISRTADHWYVSISVQLDYQPEQCKNQAVVGVDIGIKTLAVLSDGKQFFSSNPLRIALKKLRRLQKSLHRKVKGSANRKKAQLLLARLYERISFIRKDLLNKLTTYLCKTFKFLAIEDLNVKGMVKNHHLARAILDVGFGEFRRQLEYKAKLHGNQIFLIDRWFPSSKKCSSCGAIHHDLKLFDRTFHCPTCGFTIDRDLNAAINLKNQAVLQLGMANADVMLMDTQALTDSNIGETGVSEVRNKFVVVEYA